MRKTSIVLCSAWLLLGCEGGTQIGDADGQVGQVSQALTAPTQINGFVLLASGRANLKDRTVVSGGNVGVGPGSGDSLTAGFDAKIAQGKSTLGTRLVLNDRAALGDLFATSVTGPLATYTSLSPYTSPPTSPSIAAFSAGTAAVTVSTPLTLAAGNYGQVTVNSTLTLSGGTYQIQNLTLGNNASVLASAATLLRVAGRVSGGNFNRIAATGLQGAGALRLVVASASDTTGGVVLGTDAQVTALVLSKASFLAADRLTAVGALAARDITMGVASKFTFSTGFECNADASCDDSNPCTTDSCVDGRCTHPALPNGTACPDDGNVCTSDACSSGQCAHPALANGTACTSDNNVCTNDRCTSGTCTHPAVTNGTACTDDGNVCTGDQCASGACIHPAVANGTVCPDEGNACTSNACAGGSCAHPAVADGTACAADSDGASDDECKAGVCTRRPIQPFVNCVSEVSPNSFMALFGYESALSGTTTVPGGTDNHLEPASSLPDAQPPTQFAPGEHATAFWAPFDGTEVSWLVQGVRAKATPASPRCGAAQYPASPGGSARRPGETHSTPAPPAVRPASYTLGAFPAAAASKIQALDFVPPFAPPFTVTLTFIEVGNDECFRSRYADAEVFIRGISTGRKHVYDDGCVFCVDSCNLRVREINVPFSLNTPPDFTSVDVRVKLYEVDGDDDDTVLDFPFTVDNHVGQPEDCRDGSDSWGACWTVQTTGLPEFVEPRVCTTWNASYLDSGLGEDDPGTPVAGAGFSRYPAAFAQFQLAVAGPLGSSEAGGFLDAEGCVPPGFMPKENYPFIDGAAPGDSGSLEISLNIDALYIQRPDNVTYSVASADYFTTVQMSSTIPGQVPIESWTTSGQWRVPPARIDVTNSTITPVTNIAATLGTILNRPDTGHQPETGFYHVWQGGPFSADDCGFVDRFGRAYCESVGGSNLFHIGYQLPVPTAATCQADTDCLTNEWCAEARCANAPAGVDCRMGNVHSGFGGTDLPCRAGQSATCYCTPTDDSRWKFSIGHEAGHQVEERGIGSLPHSDFTFLCPTGTTCTGRKGELVGLPALLSDPPLVPTSAPFCSCEFVTSANGLHCLQSIERGATAQSEGFGQFFSSRIWNQQNEADCKFGYYKEFFDHTCDNASCFAAGAGFVNPPPVPIDCVNPHRWRNRNCPISGDMSTEIDWMGLLYSLNSTGSQRSPMTDIWKIYRQACLPPPAVGSPPDTNPPVCVPDIPFYVGWEAATPGLPLGRSFDRACLTNTDCSTTETCCERPIDSVEPCTSGADCRCKAIRTCTSDADCAAGTSCRDDATGSALPCQDGTCVCKVLKSCTVDADCVTLEQARCRGTGVGFPPCTGTNCACISYPQAGFLDGARLQYAGDTARISAIALRGDMFGVSRNLTP